LPQNAFEAISRQIYLRPLTLVLQLSDQNSRQTGPRSKLAR